MWSCNYALYKPLKLYATKAIQFHFLEHRADVYISVVVVFFVHCFASV